MIIQMLPQIASSLGRRREQCGLVASERHGTPKTASPKPAAVVGMDTVADGTAHPVFDRRLI